MSKPTYPYPTEELIERSIQSASIFASFTDPHIVALTPTRIMPRETVVLEQDLIDLMREAPGTIPPIVVAPWGDCYVVVDGHHRLAASFEAGLEFIWAITTDLKKIEHIVSFEFRQKDMSYRVSKPSGS